MLRKIYPVLFHMIQVLFSKMFLILLIARTENKTFDIELKMNYY